MAGWIPNGMPPPPGAMPQNYPPEWDQDQPLGYDATLPPGIPPFEDPQGIGAPQQPLDLSTPQEFASPPSPEGLAPSPEQEPPQQPNGMAPWWAGAAQQVVPQAAETLQANQNRLPDNYSRNGQQMDPEMESVAQIGSLKARQDQILAEGNTKNAQDYAASIKANETKRLEEEAIAKKSENDVAAAWDEVSKAKVDPNHWWNSQDTSHKAVSLIGAAIGGFLGVRNGTGKNTFMDHINANIQRDIAAQESNIGNMAKGASQKQSLYGQMLQRFGNADVARNMTAATLFNAQSIEIQAQASKLKSPISKEEANLANIQVLQGRDGALAAAQQSAFKNGLELAKVETDRMQQQETVRNNKAGTGLGYANLAEQKRQNDMQDKQKTAELAEKKSLAGPQAIPLYGKEGPAAGPVGYAADPKVVDRANLMMEGMTALDALAKEGEALLKDDYAIYGSDRRDEIEAWNTKWANAQFRATGRTDAPTSSEIHSMGIDPSRIIGDNRVKFRKQYDLSKAEANAKLRFAGVTESYLKAGGFVDPPKDENTGKTEATLMVDEPSASNPGGVGYNTEGKGRPATPEQERGYRTLKKGESERQTGSLQAWKRKRYENNLYFSQGGKGKMPWPEVGTGSIE